MFSLSEESTINISQSSILTLTKKFTTSDASVPEYAYNIYSIPDGTTDFAIDLCRITKTKYVYIESDKLISIKFDNIANTGYSTKFLLINIEATAIYISNDSGQNASISVVLGGE